MLVPLENKLKMFNSFRKHLSDVTFSSFETKRTETNLFRFVFALCCWTSSFGGLDDEEISEERSKDDVSALETFLSSLVGLF